MKWKLGTVLSAALLIELMNFSLLAFPIDAGYPPSTPWYIQLIGFQWVFLHLPGLFSLSWFEKMSGCNQLSIVMGCRRVDNIALFVGGYITTALVLLAVTFGSQRFLRWRRKRLAGPAQLANQI